jgi:hypothetical protein
MSNRRSPRSVPEGALAPFAIVFGTCSFLPKERAAVYLPSSLMRADLWVLTRRTGAVAMGATT